MPRPMRATTFSVHQASKCPSFSETHRDQQQACHTPTSFQCLTGRDGKEHFSLTTSKDLDSQSPKLQYPNGQHPERRKACNFKVDDGDFISREHAIGKAKSRCLLCHRDRYVTAPARRGCPLSAAFGTPSRTGDPSSPKPPYVCLGTPFLFP